jgi:hypothetical protein
MVLIFLSVGLGILDFTKIWVNPTYLSSGLLGGLIMGVGFIIGGFCPGTSVVSAATLKIDGIFFALGVLFGVWSFGETVEFFWEWWNTSGYYGRLTLMDVLNQPAGVVVIAVVLMALFMFWGGEQLERIFGKRNLKNDPRLRIAAAGALFVVALAVMIIGTPDTAEKYARIASEKDAALAAREVQIHPGELLTTIGDDRLQVVMLDVRPEADYNKFHIQGARQTDPYELLSLAQDLIAQQANNKVVVVMSNDEESATATWKTLVAEGVPNVYILEGGINNWLATFAAEDPEITPTPAPPGLDKLRYSFPAALGSRYLASFPNPHEWELEYIPKIKLQLKRDKSGGGCG